MPEPTVLSMNRVISGMKNMLNQIIGADIKLLIQCAPDLGNTAANPSQMQQVILNLVLNARDAMPKGGHITLRTENVFPSWRQQNGRFGSEQEPRVMLEVSDTGMGMDARIRAHVFKPFFTTKKSGHGHGLGLPTVHAIVSQSGGVVEMESQAGRGTCMRVLLPLGAGARPRARPPVPYWEPGSRLRNSSPGKFREFAFPLPGAQFGPICQTRPQPR